MQIVEKIIKFKKEKYEKIRKNKKNRILKKKSRNHSILKTPDP